jgi:hypothetical protein
MAQVVVGAIVGLLVSLLAWWLVTRWPLPRLLVSKVCKDAARRGGTRWRYRVKLVNARRPWHARFSAVIDIRVVATLRVKGLDPRDDEKWNNYQVPIVNDGAIPVFDETPPIVQLKAHEIDLAHKPDLAEYVRRANEALGLERDGPLDLQAVLKFGHQNRLRLRVTASDAYTHATTTRIVRYCHADIEEGKFRRGSGRRDLDIVRDATDKLAESAPSGPKSRATAAADDLTQGLPRGAKRS